MVLHFALSRKRKGLTFVTEEEVRHSRFVVAALNFEACRLETYEASKVAALLLKESQAVLDRA
jgi:hypothetical protein